MQNIPTSANARLFLRPSCVSKRCNELVFWVCRAREGARKAHAVHVTKKMSQHKVPISQALFAMRSAPFPCLGHPTGPPPSLPSLATTCYALRPARNLLCAEPPKPYLGPTYCYGYEVMASDLLPDALLRISYFNPPKNILKRLHLPPNPWSKTL